MRQTGTHVIKKYFNSFNWCFFVKSACRIFVLFHNGLGHSWHLDNCCPATISKLTNNYFGKLVLNQNENITDCGNRAILFVPSLAPAYKQVRDGSGNLIREEAG